MLKTMVIEIVVKIAIDMLPSNNFLLPTLSTKYPKIVRVFFVSHIKLISHIALKANLCTVEILRRGAYSPKLLRNRLKYNKKTHFYNVEIYGRHLQLDYAHNFLLVCNSNSSNFPI